MNTVHALLVGCLTAIIAMSCGVNPPRRPSTVPSEATWAGGPDGGAWILCVAVVGVNDRQTCTVYYDSTSDGVWAHGDYVLRRSKWDPIAKQAKYQRIDTPSILPRYQDFDGRKIHFQGDLVLIPVGLDQHTSQAGG